MSEFTDEKYNLYNEYAAQHGFAAIWSVYRVSDFNDFSNITADKLVYRDHWGPSPVEVILPPGKKTWGELYAAADRAIRQSGDKHHVFIEMFYADNGVAYLVTGS